MESRTDYLDKEIGKVLIPAEFLEQIEDCLDTLNHRIMDRAVVRAFARQRGLSAGVVTAEDLLVSARGLAPSIVADLKLALKSCEVNHARKAS